MCRNARLPFLTLTEEETRRVNISAKFNIVEQLKKKRSDRDPIACSPWLLPEESTRASCKMIEPTLRDFDACGNCKLDAQ